jgi:acid phosphatase family membrane protein YuiD
MLFSVIKYANPLELFTSQWFWCGLGGWLVASFIKMIFGCVKKGKLDIEYLIATGGMPSSHSATVSGLAFGIGYTESFSSPIAVLAFAFAFITMFDAATIRRAAGEHAKFLNALIKDIKELNFKPHKTFKELLGHTRNEVFWGMITGIVWSTFLSYVWGR